MSDSSSSLCIICGGSFKPNDSQTTTCTKCLVSSALQEILQENGGDEGIEIDIDGSIISISNQDTLQDSAAEMEELQKFFPEFEFVELLGEGGMGSVYKALDTGKDRTVAVKVMKKEYAEDREFVARFEREAETLAQLDHPNIIKSFDFGDREGYYFLVMEFVDGKDLEQLILEKALDAKTAIKLMPTICDAIQFAHDEGIIHRDIKSANILVDSNSQIKIADFGLAKIDDPAAELSLTSTGTAVGTVAHIAPELFDPVSVYNKRSDIYDLALCSIKC